MFRVANNSLTGSEPVGASCEQVAGSLVACRSWMLDFVPRSLDSPRAQPRHMVAEFGMRRICKPQLPINVAHKSGEGADLWEQDEHTVSGLNPTSSVRSRIFEVLVGAASVTR